MAEIPVSPADNACACCPGFRGGWVDPIRPGPVCRCLVQSVSVCGVEATVVEWEGVYVEAAGHLRREGEIGVAIPVARLGEQRRIQALPESGDLIGAGNKPAPRRPENTFFPWKKAVTRRLS